MPVATDPACSSRCALRRRASAAFSLVELSVVIAIISVVAVMGLEVTATMMNRTAYQTTAEKLETIDRAMVEFRRVYNRLPCPAMYPWTLTSPCYGKEYNSSNGVFTCDNNAGTCNAAVLTGGAGLYGHVPARDLGLPLSVMVDGYGNRIWYIVTTNQVYNATVNPANNFVNTADGLAVRSGKLDSTCGPSTLCQDRGNASYFLFSTGADKRGGITPGASVAGVACFGGTPALDDGKIDTANCRLNGATTLMKNGATAIAPAIPMNVFYDSRYNNGSQESTHFDDAVKWRSKKNL